MADLPLTDLLAIERTRLAAERTLLSYIRTALALVAGGLTLIHVFISAASSVVGAVMLGLGVLTFLFGIGRWLQLHRRFKR